MERKRLCLLVILLAVYCVALGLIDRTVLPSQNKTLLDTTGACCSCEDAKIPDAARDMSKWPVFEDMHQELRNSSITAINHPVQEIQKLIDGITIKGGYLAVATANVAHLEFVLNLQESMRRNLRLDKNLLVVCLDDELVDALKSHGIATLKFSELLGATVDSSFLQDTGELKSQQIYGTETYNELVNMKIDVAYILLRYYTLERLIYTDVDVAWLQPKLVEYFDFLFRPSEEKKDVLFTTSGSGNFYPCTGFYVMKKSKFSVSFLGSILGHSEKSVKHDQQIALEIYDALEPYLQQKIYALEPVLFIDGNSRAWGEFYGVRPWIFHANFVVGFEAKKTLLSQLDCWYL